MLMNVKIEKSEVEGKEYKVYNGTAYDIKTDDKVIQVLDRYLTDRRQQRIRIFYGDSKTGRDWNEEFDVIGYVGRSTGTFKIPLLIRNRNSSGGGAILTGCIVKITVDKETVYQHPLYNCNDFKIKNADTEDLVVQGYLFKVIRNDKENCANFKNEKKAQNYISFMQGKRNKVA